MMVAVEVGCVLGGGGGNGTADKRGSDPSAAPPGLAKAGNRSSGNGSGGGGRGLEALR